MVVTLRGWIDLKFRLEIIAVCWSVFIDLILNLLFFYTVSNVQAQPLGCPLEQATGVRNRVTGRTQRLRFLIWYQKCKKKFLVNQLASSWNAVYLVFGARGSHVEVAEVVGSGLVSGWAHFEAGAPDQNVQLGQRWQKDVTDYGQRLI